MIEKIVSGGQTGVDRAALDVALELGIPCGGWCPKGRKAEDGVIPDKYPLQEASSSGYRVRTEKNVRDSDGTLILYKDKLEGGSLLTSNLAKKYGKPDLIIDLNQLPQEDLVRDWIEENGVRVLNIAGPREGGMRGIYHDSIEFLRKTLGG